MKQLKDYVRVYDDAIDTSLAKLLINVFENNEDSHRDLRTIVVLSLLR